MNEKEDGDQGLANEGAGERYYVATGSDRPPRRLVLILADMVETAMKRVRGIETETK